MPGHIWCTSETAEVADRSRRRCGGIVTGSVTNPMGMIVGFIDNPHFGG
jgi:hypothetical protein